MSTYYCTFVQQALDEWAHKILFIGGDLAGRASVERKRGREWKGEEEEILWRAHFFLQFSSRPERSRCSRGKVQ